MDRTEFLLQGLCQSMHGIEIGPFYSPIAPVSAGWNTIVVDFTDTNSLRHIAQTHSQQAIRDMATKVEPVDVVWRNTTLDAACLKLRPQGFDYLIASHVIEHVPDLIGFLKQAAALARPGFVMPLAVPDCRLCFDFFKPLSKTSDALWAHIEKRQIHSPVTMFDTYAYMAWQDGSGAWSQDAIADLALPNTLDEAHEQYLACMAATQAEVPDYVDAHCWYWTPSSFELMILELNHLGYIPFTVEEIVAGPCSEFLARLRLKPHGLHAATLHRRRLQLLQAVCLEVADKARFVSDSRRLDGVRRCQVGVPPSAWQLARYDHLA